MEASSNEQQALEERIKELEAKFDLLKKELSTLRMAVVLAYVGIIILALTSR